MSSDAGMPRELLVWMRSLRLPRVVRHPKRDLSNGFLVALICSRYWSNVSMHSYEDKLSEANKRSNWEMLRIDFARNNCPISDNMIDGMIACRDGYANSLLRQLYTQLTGHVIVEAPPLLAATVDTPQRLMTHQAASVSAKLSVNIGRASPDNPNLVTSRVRELPARGLAALKGAVRVSAPTATKRRIFQAMTDDPGNRDASAAPLGEGQGEKNIRPPMQFSVSLRRSEARQTVALPPVRHEKQKSQSVDHRDEWQQQMDGSCPGMDADTPIEVIEAIVRKQAAGQNWPCASDDATAFTTYFLHDETTLGALVQYRVWSALFSGVNEVVESVFRCGASLAKVVELFLATPSSVQQQQQQQQQNHWSHQQGQDRLSSFNSSSTLGGTWMKQVKMESFSVPQRYTFVVSLLANMSVVDAFITASVYCEDVLPHVKVPLCTLEYPTADIHALLLCAALPADRNLAARLLPDVLSALYDALTGLNNIQGRCGFYLLLRAVLLRLSHPVQCSSTRSPSRRSESVVSMSTVIEDDILTASVIAITRYNVVAALSHESPTMRLVGAHLATALASASCCPIQTLFHTVLPLLRESIAGASGLFSCLCATWLQLTVRGLNTSFSDLITTTTAGEEYEDSRARTIAHMAALVNSLRFTLQMPGPKKIKLRIAELLTLCLDEFSSTDEMRRLFNADELAVCILTTLKTAAEGSAAAFLSPPSSEDGRPRSRLSRLGHPDTSTLLCSPLLGPLHVNGSLRDCYPLALAEAVIVVFSPHEELSPTSLDGKANSRRGSSLSGTTATTTSGNVSSRQIIVEKATKLLNEGVIPEGTAQRVKWMYTIIVSSRGDSGFPERPVSLTAEVAAKRWGVVLQQMYIEIALLTAAAEMIFSQKGAMVDTGENSIAQMAGMAQQVVLRWYTELHSENRTLVQSTDANASASGGNVSRTSAVTLNSRERLVEAMLWYRKSFGGVEVQEQAQENERHQKPRSNSKSFRGAVRRWS